MKKILLFSFVLLCILNVNAQTSFNRVYHSQKEVTGPLLINIHNDYYYSANTYNFGDFGNCYIYKYGNNGNLKARIPFQSNLSTFAILNAAIKTNDNKLLLVGHIYGVCDVADTSLIRTFISKIDTNGNVLFITKIKRPYGIPFSPYGADNFKNVLQNTDSTYCTFTDSVMYKFSKTGQLLFRKNLALDSISSCLLLQNNSILLSAKQNNVKSLVEISQTGNLIGLQPSALLYKKLSFYNAQKISALGIDGRIYKIRPDLSLIGISSATVPAIKDFICENDTIYSISNNNYTVNDTSFNVLSVSTNTTQKFNQVALCKNGSLIGITAACATGGINNGHSFSSIIVINRTGNNNFTNDIEISAVTPDSVFCTLNGFNEFYVYLRAKVKVKNKGATVINRFTLNSDRNTAAICGGHYYEQTFTQTLLQGDSVIVTTSFIHKRYLTMAPIQPTLSIQYCLFLTMPNDGNDKFIANDELCQNFIFPNPTSSLKELNNLNNLIKIYPVPFDNTVTIESEASIKRIEITNTLGSLIYNETINKNNVVLSNILNNQGIYFIKIETEKGTQIKKVVK